MTDLDALHHQSVIIDTHCDTLGRVYEGQRRLGEASRLGQFDLPRARAGGLTCELLATFMDTCRSGSGIRQTLHYIDIFYQELDAYPDLALLALSTADIARAKAEGKVALMLSMEGAEGLEGDMRALRVFYRLGLRCLGLTWNRRNEAADGLGERRSGGGLTEFGVELVKECNRLGIVLDLAHLAPAGVQDVLALSEAPVVATHANCHALWPHPRNLTDAQLEGIARSGGVVGVTPVPPFLGPDECHSRLDVLLNHVDHMLTVMGENHVGLGLDFDGVGDIRTEGLEDIAKLPNLTQALAERGHNESTIRKILGENFLRVFKAVL